MARNKKKSASQQQRKHQQKQQRRSARKQRQGTARTFAAAHALSVPNITALPELAPFLNTGAGSTNMMAMMELAIDSADLLEEPEFDQAFIEPLEAMATLINTAEAMGLGPDILQEAITEREDEAKEKLVSELCQRLLTPALRRQLIDGLNNLHRRLHKPAEQALRQRAAAVQFLLEAEQTNELVPFLGFVRTLIFRSIEAGFALAGAALEMEKVEEQAGSLSLQALHERLANSEWGAQLEQAVEQSPGLRQYLESQIDQMYEDGLKATFTGELMLNLFSADEVAVVLQMVRTAFEAQKEGREEDNTFAEIMGSLIPQLTTYIVQLFTPDRLEQLRNDLAALAVDPAYAASKWAPFLRMKQENFAEDDAIDSEQRFLVAALLGQVLPILKAEEEDEAEQEESADDKHTS